MALNKISAWSFSRWSVYDLCPAKAKYKFLDRLPEPGSPQMERGSEIHKGLENFIRGALPRLSKEHNPKVFGELLKSLRLKHKKDAANVPVEQTWAYRADWSETRYDDWNNCWLRIKVDAAVIDGDQQNMVVDIIDWKTGKFRSQDEATYALQLDLYALGALTKYKDVAHISVLPSLVYIDEGVRHSVGTYTQQDLPRLKKEWTKRAKPMLSDTAFAPKPNNLCKWCHYRKDNGGPCQF